LPNNIQHERLQCSHSGIERVFQKKGGKCMKFKKTAAALLCAAVLAVVPANQAAQAFSLGNIGSLGGILKAGGIAIVVDQYAGQLNSFINSLMAKNGVSSEYATKVVPIISTGDGSYAGAAQVVGPQALVDKTKAVLQVEAEFGGSTFRVKGLIPIDSKNVTGFNRVQGVGVSAQIDVKI